MGPQEQERIYFVGGTGGVGAKAIQDVLANNIPITIYTRRPEKSCFKDHPQVTHVQGSYDDLTPFEQSIGGHTRMFLLVRSLGMMPRIKGAMAKAAYAAGVKQIVAVSSLTVSVHPFTFIGQAHARSEDAIRAIQSVDATYVILRPWRFMSNYAIFAKHVVQTKTLVSVAAPDTPQGWISTDDIGALAAIILRDPIEKHGDAIYPMVGELLTANQQTETLSKLLGFAVAFKR
ncbi:hypothetical protein BDB00DRAFT_891370 [Zychaea mexicana]|uniref:uncharacterized protein n=1 Tax=Zychaea mexicana TaxID=64656 RepID=UPI0022FE1374|nr:uncharacterized protein BDB00DRAFT_891370 [Zychaea mexicana]KAI9496719.1 hypothetical protein BDB00DRAFT_891370 [Zychaea mexicana]